MSNAKELSPAQVIVLMVALIAVVLLLMSGEWYWFFIVGGTAAAWGLFEYNRSHEYEGTPKTHHFVHIVMVLVTGGLWLIPWFLLHQRTKTRRHQQVIAEIQRQNRKERNNP